MNSQTHAGIILIMAISAMPTSAKVIDTYPDWDGNITNGWFAVAQSLVAPADNVLHNYMFALAPPGKSDTVTFSVFEWNSSSGPIGAPLFSTESTWPVGGGDVLVADMDLELVSGELYAAVVDMNGYLGESVHFQENRNSYTDGRASWKAELQWDLLDSDFNTKFRAEFVPEPSSAVLLLLGLGLIRLRRE